jgi:hypothetical protein
MSSVFMYENNVYFLIYALKNYINTIIITVYNIVIHQHIPKIIFKSFQKNLSI